MPRGVPIPDLHRRLFDAAEAVLERDGAQGLTSRAVTEEAGCAKGLLHKEFGDFDGFLVALVLDRAAWTRAYGLVLRERAGKDDVTANVVEGLRELLNPTASAIVALLIFRDELRARLREELPGMPLMSDVAAALAGYLHAEQDLGRLPKKLDVDALAPMLIGSAHLLLADRATRSEADGELRRVVGVALR